MKKCAVAILVVFTGIIAAPPCLAQELKLVKTLEGDTNGVFSVAFNPKGGVLASGSATGVKLWDLKTYKEKRILDGYGVSLAFSPDATLLAAGSGSDIKLWNVKTGKEDDPRLIPSRS